MVLGNGGSTAFWEVAAFGLVRDRAQFLSFGEFGLKATARRLDGEPERRIPEFVAREGVDLLVLGAPSHSRLHTLVLGSTTSALLRGCVIPALLLR